MNFATGAPPTDASPARDSRTSLYLGVAAWLLAAAWLLPTPFATEWAVLILLLAPLVLVPLALRLLLRTDPLLAGAGYASLLLGLPFPSAVLLLVAFVAPLPVVSGILTVPWLVTTLVLAAHGLRRLARPELRTPGELTVTAGLVYIPVGGGWATLSAFGVRPLGFEPVIVLLTGIHFHYAGFVLPIVTGLSASALAGRLPRLAAVAVVLGVPAVAVGITATQLGLSPAAETAAAWLMSVAGVLTALLLIRLASTPTSPATARALWTVAALSLLFTTTLSALYGTRAFWPLAWLDIPWMRALHGTANAFGFALLALLAWTRTRPAGAGNAPAVTPSGDGSGNR